MRKKLIRLSVFACVTGLLFMIPALGMAQRGVVADPAQQAGKGKKGKGGGDVNQFQMPGQVGGFGQQPGGKAGKGGKGGITMAGGMNLDPNRSLTHWPMDKIQFRYLNSDNSPMPLQQYALQNGNSSGYITRQQFGGFMQTYASTIQAALGGAAGKGGKGKGGDPDAVAAQRFKSADKNMDGFLSPDEMSAQLRDSGIWKKYDNDGNGVLVLDEYKAYWRDQSAATQGFAGGKGNPALNAAMMIIEEEWDQRPVVYRTGKLPQGLPKWFQELDADRDAQVGLYEWKTSQKQPIEFQLMDRNGDCLLTVDEVLWHLKAVASIGGPGMTTAAYSQGLMGFQNGNTGFGGKKGGGKKGGGGGDFNFGGGGGGKKGGGAKKGGGGGDFNLNFDPSAFGGGFNPGGGGFNPGGGGFGGGGGGKKGGGKKGGGGDF